MAGLKAALVVALGLPLAQATAQTATGGEVTLSRQSALELLSQMEAMQAELRELRNQIEVQSHDLERLKSGQREVLRDIDQRLSKLESEAARATQPVPSTTTPTQPSTTTTPTPSTTPVTPRTTTARATASAQEQRDYEAAFNLLKQGLYNRASEAFSAFIQKYPSSPLAPNAQYWTAEANYVVRNFGLALKEFTKVVNDYPNSPKVADALLKIGYSYYEIASWENARTALNNVMQRFPNTTVSRLAQIRLNKMKEEG
ncbi:MAG: tol-pal system protein YbgF, partial [Acidiferrobacterales bacterium]